MKSSIFKSVTIVFLFFVAQNYSWGQVVSGGDFLLGTGLLTLNPKQSDNFQIGNNGWAGVGLSGGVIFYKRFVTNAGFSFGGNFPDHSPGTASYIGHYWQSFIEGGIIQSIIPFEVPDAKKHYLLIGLTMGYNGGVTLRRMYDQGRGMVDSYDNIGSISGEYFFSPSIFINVEEGICICITYRHFLNQTGMQSLLLFQLGGLKINLFEP